MLGFFVLLPAIFLSSVTFTRGAGIYAAILSTAVLYWFLTPVGSALLPGRFILSLLLFLLVSLTLAVLGEGMRPAWERAAAAERVKDVLLQELGHRTKNNLAMVISMLSMQARLKSEKLCGRLGDVLRDVRSIAVRVAADEVYLTTEKAVPVGLIVNELVTNALKHAFPESRAGTVDVIFTRQSSLTLIVKDDGIGCATSRCEDMGSRLTRLLSQQPGASIVWEVCEPGCQVRVVLAGN